MLEKISDIHLDTRPKESQRNLKNKKISKRAYAVESGTHDSLSISPAIIYLSKQNFLLNEIVKQSENKILLNFDIDKLNFKINIDPADIQNNGQLLYVITKEQKDFSSGKNCTIWTKFKLGKFEEQLSNLVQFDTIHLLFDHISHSSLNYDEKIYNPEIFELMLDGLETNLIEEFGKLSHVILKFAEKLLEVNILSKLKQSNEPNSILLQRIKLRTNES